MEFKEESFPSDSIQFAVPVYCLYRMSDFFFVQPVSGGDRISNSVFAENLRLNNRNKADFTVTGKIYGIRPDVKFIYSGIRISGPSQDIDFLSDVLTCEKSSPRGTSRGRVCRISVLFCSVVRIRKSSSRIIASSSWGLYILLTQLPLETFNSLLKNIYVMRNSVKRDILQMKNR